MCGCRILANFKDANSTNDLRPVLSRSQTNDVMYTVADDAEAFDIRFVASALIEILLSEMKPMMIFYYLWWDDYSTVWVKQSLLSFTDNFPKRSGSFSPNFTCLLYVPIYAGLQILFNYLQLWRSYAIFSATTIICSKCLPLAETHAGWSHLIWHNFVKIGNNWIKVSSLA